MHESIYSKNRSHEICLMVGWFGIISTILYMLFLGTGNIWDLFIFQSGNDRFMDFFNHIQYCNEPDQVYFVSIHACFPALAYVFYYLIGRLLPEGQITYWNASMTGGYAYLIYVLYTVLLIVILCNLISIVLNGLGRSYILLFEIQIFLSYPFVAGIFERGNASFLCLVLLLLAIMLRDSDNSMKREMALILIAVAAGFKVYPAIFGLLYILEKRYRETVHLLIYGIVAFFTPFIWFGGKKGFVQFLRNQMAIQSEGTAWTIKGYIQKFAEFIEISDSYIGEIFTYVIYIALLFCVIMAICKTKKLYLRLILLVSIMVLFPFWSGSYVISYFLIPLLIFLRDEKKANMFGYSMGFSFGLIFTLIAYSESIPHNTSVLGCYLVTMLAFGKSLLGENHRFEDNI